MNEIPIEFHPYVTPIQNARGDGNYGFCIIAVCLGYIKDNWHQICLNIHNELLAYSVRYTHIFFITI